MGKESSFWAPEHDSFMKPLYSRPESIADLTERKKNRNIDKMRWQRSMFQIKEQDKIPERGLNEMEISIILEKYFKVTVTRCSLNRGKELMTSVRTLTKR